MAIVQIQQFDAHLAAAPKLDWVQVGEEQRAKATFVAISNDVRGSGESRRDKPTSILWTVWGPAGENHAAYLPKGAHVNVTGRMESHRYTDADSGETVYGYTFIADAVHYLDTKEQAQARREASASASDSEKPSPLVASEAPVAVAGTRRRATRRATNRPTA